MGLLKVKTIVFIFFITVSFYTNSYSQTAPQTKVRATGLYPMFAMESGAYQFLQESYDKSEIQKNVLDILRQRNETDYKYYLQTVTKVQEQFRTFIRETIYKSGEVKGNEVVNAGGLKWLSDQSVNAGKKVQAGVYLEALNRFNEEKYVLESLIKTLTSVVGSLPSQIPVELDGSGAKNIPNYGNINFASIESFYEQKVQEFTQFLSDLPQMYVLNNGNTQFVQANSGKGLIFQQPDIVINPEKIQELYEQVARYRSLRPEQQEKVSPYLTDIKKLVQKFVDAYGTTERYRIQRKDQLEAREKAYRDIVIAFWSRSYLRAAYGIPLGTMGIRYTNKKWANADFFTAMTTGVFHWVQEPVFEQSDIMTIKQDYLNAINTLDSRHQSVTKVFTGDVSILSGINSLMTFVGGYRTLAEVSTMVLKLLIADLQEEETLIVEGDLAELKAFYKARYFGTESDEKFYRNLRRVYDPSAGEKPDANSTQIVSVGAIRNHFNTAKTVALTKQSELKLARELELQIAGMVNALTSEELQAVEERKKEF